MKISVDSKQPAVKNNRQVAILAGGLGTRLRPITERVPKPLVEVAGQPFLYWQLLDLKNQGYTRILLLVAYLGEKIQNHFGDGNKMGLELSYSFEPEPLGTGGAIKLACEHLDSEFILLNGDSFLKIDLQSLENEFQPQKMDALISTYDNHIKTPVTPNLNLKVSSGDSVYEVLSYSRAGGPVYTYIDAGVYILKRSLFELCKDSKFQLETVLHQKMKEQKVFAHPSAERFYDIGTPERLKEFEEKVHDYFKDTVSY